MCLEGFFIRVEETPKQKPLHYTTGYGLDMRVRGFNVLRIIKKTRPAPEEKSGFTLVEVLVTLAILAAVLPALLQAFASAARNQGLSDNSTTALYLLKYRMAEIEMEGYPDVGDESDEFGENTRYRWRSVVEDVDSEDVENIRRVQVTVTWLHRNRERSISMTTYIADRQISQNSDQPSAVGSR